MASLAMRLERGAIDLVFAECAEACPSGPADTHMHLTVGRVRRWHPGYWLLIARATLQVLGSVRIRRAA